MSTLSAVYEIFWQRFLTLPVTLFTPHEKKKTPHAGGSLRLLFVDKSDVFSTSGHFFSVLLLSHTHKNVE